MAKVDTQTNSIIDSASRLINSSVTTAPGALSVFASKMTMHGWTLHEKACEWDAYSLLRALYLTTN